MFKWLSSTALILLVTTAIGQESATVEIGAVSISGIPMSIGLQPTTVTLQPTTEPNAVAEIIFHNIDVNGNADTKTYTLTTDTLTVDVFFEYTEGNDSLTVYPPEGYFADPEYVSVGENTTAETIYIYPVTLLGY